MKNFYAAVVCCLVLALCAPAIAGTSVTGIASVNYETGFFSSEVKKEIKDKAIEAALLNGWKKYTSSFNAAKYKAYVNIESDFTSQLDLYIAEYNLIDERNDTDGKKYTVAIKALLNDVAVDNKLSAVSQAGSSATGEGSLFSFIFVARDVAAVKSYDDKVTKIKKSESMSSDKETGAMSGSDMVAGQSHKSISKTTTGGSSVKKADKIKYTV